MSLVWFYFALHHSHEACSLSTSLRRPLWLDYWKQPGCWGWYEWPGSWTVTQNMELPSSSCSCAPSPSLLIGWPVSGTPSATWSAQALPASEAWRSAGWTTWLSRLVNSTMTVTKPPAPPSRTSTLQLSTSPSAVWPVWVLGTSHQTPTQRRSSPSVSCSLAVSRTNNIPPLLKQLLFGVSTIKRETESVWWATKILNPDCDGFCDLIGPAICGNIQSYSLLNVHFFFLSC